MLTNNEYGGASYPAAAQCFQGLVGLFEGERHDFGADGYFWGEREELQTVLAREVGHRAYGALAPEDLVGEGRDVAHVYARADHGPAPGDGPEGRGNEGADRCEDDRRVQFLGRCLFGTPGPLGT